MEHTMDFGHPHHPTHPDTLVVSKKRLRIFLTVVVIFALLSFVAAGYAFYHVSTVKSELSTLRDAQGQNSDQLVAEIGKLIILPEGEEPTIATVVDPESLRGQPFFKNAKAGDRVLIYAKDSRAVLYDPVAKRVVEIGYLGAPLGEGGISQ